jgi:transcriptional regulator with XRE-family HTH domain
VTILPAITVLSNLAFAADGCATAKPSSVDATIERMAGRAETLSSVLRDARRRHGMSLRDVERRTGIRNAHLSQLETGVIARPEPALIWELAVLYELDFTELLELAGHGGRQGARGERMTVALRALGDLTAEEQSEVLRFMADLKRRRSL